MSDKPDPKELETMLARLENEWQELANLLKSQGQPQLRAIEVEKILLRDASGKYRGKISVNEDGSAGLLLSDNEGNAWAWLGVNRDGEAFLELKDHKKEIKFKVPIGPPALEVGEEISATFIADLDQEPEPQSFEAPDTSPPPTMPAAEVGAPQDVPGAVEPPPISFQDRQPGGEADVRVLKRLEKLERQNRRQRYYRVLTLVVLAVILAAQAFVLIRPRFFGPLEAEALVVRDQNGIIRAWLGDEDGKFGLNLWDQKGKRRATLGLGADGSPGLSLYDQHQRIRGEFNLGHDGEPKFNVQDNLSLLGKTEQNIPNDLGNQQSLAGTVSGSEEGTVAGPAANPTASLAASPAIKLEARPATNLTPSPETSPAASLAASQAEAVSPDRDAEAEVVYMGSKTSNKYHYPTCKWARTIKHAKRIYFKSAQEAEEQHYIPCPVCKPPPLGK